MRPVAHSLVTSFLLCVVWLTPLSPLSGQNFRKGATKDEVLQVFPNPSSGKFTVQVKEQQNSFHINVYNLIGEVVLRWESPGNDGATLDIDLTRKPEGVYFVELDTDEANTVRRIVIDRN